MATFQTKDGDGLYLDCSCGCGEGLKVEVRRDADLYVLLSYTSGNFYRAQESGWRRFRKKLKKIFCILRNREYVYSEICMTRSDLEEFKAYVARIE